MRVLSRRRVLALGALGTTAAVFGGGCESGREVEHRRAPMANGDVRRVTGVFEGTPSIDGAGVHLTRMLGGRSLPLLDPFLLLDQIHSENPDDYVRGFPRHPHRGFETVTYMISGAMEHRDILGNHGRLGPGAAQWMTAGHGIVHEEMPRQDSGELWGFQFWVNLPRRSKMMAPRYQDIAPERVAETSVSGSRVRLVAGRIGGVVGPVDGIEVDPTLLDATLTTRGKLSLEIPREHTAFALLLQARCGSRERQSTPVSSPCSRRGASSTSRATSELDSCSLRDARCTSL